MPPVVAALAAIAVSACGEAPGAADADRYSVELRPLNDSGVEGRARLDREGEHLAVTIVADGLAPDQIHGQGLHGFVEQRRPAECADGESGDAGPPADDEGASAYGPRLRALEPFPTVGSDGRLAYRLTFTIDPDQVEPLDSRALVLRGASRDGAPYRPGLPVACGRLRSVARAGA